MKTLIFASFLVLFSISNFGFISDSGIKEIKKHSCPFIQQIRISGENPNNKNDNLNKSECPFLIRENSKCPFLKGEVKESESKSCPYSGKDGYRKSNSDKKIKTLDVKIS